MISFGAAHEDFLGDKNILYESSHGPKIKCGIEETGTSGGNLTQRIKVMPNYIGVGRWDCMFCVRLVGLACVFPPLVLTVVYRLFRLSFRSSVSVTVDFHRQQLIVKTCDDQKETPCLIPRDKLRLVLSCWHGAKLQLVTKKDFEEHVRQHSAPKQECDT